MKKLLYGFCLVLACASIALAITTVTATVTWINPTSGATVTSIRVERNTNGGAFAQVGATLAASATTFTDTAQPIGFTYCYRVIEANAFGDAPPSNHACVAALAPAGATNATVTYTTQ